MDADSPHSDGKEALVRRACDQCRQRKIRCDKRSPCSNCRTSKIICSSTGAGQKPREPRKRVLISNEYEKKIDHIDERLAGIEQVLHELKTSLASNKSTTSQICAHATPVSRHISPSAQEYTSNPQDAMDQQESKTGFEGNSLMASQSVYASDFLQTAVSRSPLQMSASKINSALSTLKQLVSMQDTQVPSAREFPRKKHKGLSDCDLRELVMPPMHVVIPLLRNAKVDSYGTALQTYCPFLPFDRLAEKCREVYFNTEDYSDATFIVANGGLYQLFVAASFMAKDRAQREEYQGYVDICRHNLDTTLANLHLLMPATTDSIEALTMAAAHAIEMSKPSFALTLTSTASRLCQAMGIHQTASMENISLQEKERILTLFWSIYCMDRALSLRLGRAATIPDYDIDVPASLEASTVGEPWKSAYMIWVELARIQGLVYEKLYSAAALRQSEMSRVAEARNLAARMQERVMQPFEGIYAQLNNITAIESLYMRCDEVCRLSLLCLIYRAIPPQSGTPGTFVQECIESARGALLSHKSCMSLLKDTTAALKLSYLHWSILYSPFVPFIVLFCHIIEVSSWEDLERLEEFVVSLKPNCSLSTAISKLHRLCQALSNVARLYIEARIQAQTQEDQALASVGHEFDTYLSALGFAPPADGGDARWAAAPGTTTMPGEMSYPGTAAQSISGPHMPQGHMTQLGNWFSGNQYMLGLLEEDLSMFDPSNLP
ncbi:putative C6 transcription factor [Aspergillus undulatus]|uniref:putative C6 transcription factor n=1 Tax=Aspergillus undulatus TaxID=1810928 RepID=UPI003CCE215A